MRKWVPTQLVAKAVDSNNAALDADDIINEYKYNSRSQLLEEHQKVSTAANKIVSADYADEQDRTKLIYPDDTQYVTFTYDERDRIDSISYNTNEIAHYDFMGYRLLERTYNNGTALKYHDGSGNLSGYDAHRRPVLHDNTPPSTSFTYTWDREDNRTSENSDTMTYDSAYRLKSFDHNATLSTWTLDGTGNWLNRTTGGSPVNFSVNEMNEYTAVGAATPTHDNNGNLTSNGTDTLKYDPWNRLREVNANIFYNYNASGLRVEKIVSGSTTRFYFDGAEIIEERDGSDALIRRYVNGRTMDEPLLLETGGNQYYFHTNSLGSITALTNASGSVVERYDYDAYGQATVTLDDAGIDNPRLFTAQYQDSETGLINYKLRYYDPATGRFISHDPIGMDSFGNFFQYVNGSPNNYTDPMGLIDSWLQNLPETDSRRIAIEILNQIDDVPNFGRFYGGVENCSALAEKIDDYSASENYNKRALTQLRTVFKENCAKGVLGDRIKKEQAEYERLDKHCCGMKTTRNVVLASPLLVAGGLLTFQYALVPAGKAIVGWYLRRQAQIASAAAINSALLNSSTRDAIAREIEFLDDEVSWLMGRIPQFQAEDLRIIYWETVEKLSKRADALRQLIKD